MTDYVIEPYILEAYLFNRLLELDVVEDLECVAVDKEHRISLDLCVS